MNIVMFCGKKFKKQYEAAVKQTPGIILLGTELVVRNGFASKVLEDYNPHGVLVSADVSVKDNIDVLDMLVLLKMKRPSIRIIYYYGEIQDKKSFRTAAEFLLGNNITDILVGNKTAEELQQALEFPMSTEDYLKQFEKAEESAVSTVSSEMTISYTETTDIAVNEQGKADRVELDRLSLAVHDFDIMEVVTINETVQELIEIKNISIGIAQLLSRCGSTHTAFEIARFLSSDRKKKVCVIITEEGTYNRLSDFYGIDRELSSEGFTIQDINIYPYSKRDEIKDGFNYIIIDYGCSGLEQLENDYSKCHIKLLMCSAAEWNVSVLMDFINNCELEYTADINYCFYPVSQSRFISFKKRLAKGKCRSYRFVTSQDWTLPDSYNKKTYQDIIKRYTNISPLEFKSRKKEVAKAKRKIQKKKQRGIKK